MSHTFKPSFTVEPSYVVADDIGALSEDDQIVYLGTLYPYATIKQLRHVCRRTCARGGIDEAIRHTYQLLNPDPFSLSYLNDLYPDTPHTHAAQPAAPSDNDPSGADGTGDTAACATTMPRRVTRRSSDGQATDQPETDTPSSSVAPTHTPDSRAWPSAASGSSQTRSRVAAHTRPSRPASVSSSSRRPVSRPRSHTSSEEDGVADGSANVFPPISVLLTQRATALRLRRRRRGLAAAPACAYANLSLHSEYNSTLGIFVVDPAAMPDGQTGADVCRCDDADHPGGPVCGAAMDRTIAPSEPVYECGHRCGVGAAAAMLPWMDWLSREPKPRRGRCGSTDREGTERPSSIGSISRRRSSGRKDSDTAARGDSGSDDDACARRNGGNVCAASAVNQDESHPTWTGARRATGRDEVGCCSSLDEGSVCIQGAMHGHTGSRHRDPHDACSSGSEEGSGLTYCLTEHPIPPLPDAASSPTDAAPSSMPARCNAVYSRQQATPVRRPGASLPRDGVTADRIAVYRHYRNNTVEFLEKERAYWETVIDSLNGFADMFLPSRTDGSCRSRSSSSCGSMHTHQSSNPNDRYPGTKIRRAIPQATRRPAGGGGATPSTPPRARRAMPERSFFHHDGWCDLLLQLDTHCPTLLTLLPTIAQRVLALAPGRLVGKRVLPRVRERLIRLPLIGSRLFSCKAARVRALTLGNTPLHARHPACAMEYVADPTGGEPHLRVHLHICHLEMEPTAFAYIRPRDVARQMDWIHSTRQGGLLQPSHVSWCGDCGSGCGAGAGGRLSSDACTTGRGGGGGEEGVLRRGVTTGELSVTLRDVKIVLESRVWLSVTGRLRVVVDYCHVSIGRLRVRTTSRRLNVLCTVLTPILKRVIRTMIRHALREDITL